jgi:hypothetical protein
MQIPRRQKRHSADTIEKGIGGAEVLGTEKGLANNGARRLAG